MSRFVPECPPNQNAPRQFGEADDVGGWWGVRARIIAHHFATLFQVISGGAQHRGFIWRNQRRPAVQKSHRGANGAAAAGNKLCDPLAATSAWSPGPAERGQGLPGFAAR